MAEIVLERLTKIYSDGTEAVTGLDLEVGTGEFVVFVGPSGCGKTTALRMVAGLETITSGNVKIDGEIVNDLPPKDRDIAMVFQNYALYPHMNAYKNMGFALKMRGLPSDEIDRRVREAAHILGLTDSLQKKPRTLSGGQRQRVAMGRAIVRNPQAFLMDEPLSNLDAKLRVEMRAEISRIQRDLGVTTVYVTHDQTEAMTMGDRVAVMRNGLLQQVAAPKVLYEQPRNLFVAEFIGSPAMNLVARRRLQRRRQLLGSLRPASPPGLGSRRRRVIPTSLGSTGARSSWGSGRRTWRMRRSARPQRIAACRSSATFVRTWARRSTSTSTSPRRRSRRRRCSRRTSSRRARTRRRESPPSRHGAPELASSPGSNGRRTHGSARSSRSRSTSSACTSSTRRPVFAWTASSVVVDALSPDFPLGDAVETFIRREDAERFIEEVGGEPEMAAKLRIEERELEAGGLN